MIGRRVLWAAAVRSKPLQERLTAAAANGFTHMSVFPADMATWRGQGLADRAIASMFRDAGVRANTVDPYIQWTPGFRIEDYPSEADRAFVDHDEDAVFGMTAALDAPQLNLVSGSLGELDVKATADALGRVAERARREGVNLTLEFMPISNIPDLATALAVLDTARDANVAIVFDTWHFYRGTPDLDLLAGVNGARVAEVQLADAHWELQGDLMNDLQHHRKVPGEGEFDLATVCEILRRIGAWRSVGPEIFSDEMDGLDAQTAARLARAGLDQFDLSGSIA